MNSSFSLSRFGVMSLSTGPGSLMNLGVHRDDVLSHRYGRAVGLDLGADVVALGREGKRRERTGHRDT